MSCNCCAGSICRVLWHHSINNFLDACISRFQFYQRNGRPYPISNADNLLVEILHGSSKIPPTVQLGGTTGADPSQVNVAQVSFTVHRSGSTVLLWWLGPGTSAAVPSTRFSKRVWYGYMPLFFSSHINVRLPFMLTGSFIPTLYCVNMCCVPIEGAIPLKAPPPPSFHLRVWNLFILFEVRNNFGLLGSITTPIAQLVDCHTWFDSVVTCKHGN